MQSGLFSAMKKELNSAASSISKEMDSVSKKASDKWDEHATSPLLVSTWVTSGSIFRVFKCCVTTQIDRNNKFDRHTEEINSSNIIK